MKMRRNSCGFTIVELLVTLAMTAIVVAAAYSIFGAQTKRRAVEQESMEMQQSARMALDMMARDLRMVGYWGWACDKTEWGCKSTLSTGIDGTKIFITLKENEGNEMLKKFKESGTTDFITDGIFGWNNLEDDDVACTNFDGKEDTKIKPGTDAFMLFYVDGSIPVEVAQDMSATEDPVLVGNPNGLAKLDIMLIADSSHASIFQITNNPLTETDSPIPVKHANTPRNSKDLNFAYNEGSLLFPMRVKCYWVSDPGNESDPHGGNQLRVSTLQGGDEILARNVEDLQLRYKQDTDDDGKPDTDWRSAGQVSNWSEVVLAEIWVLMKSAKKEKDYSDSKTYQFADGRQHPDPDDPEPEDASYHRMVFKRSVALRNRAMRLEE